MSDWKVGSRCQRGHNNNDIMVGVVSAVETEERERRNYDYYSRKDTVVKETITKQITVKWDDGTEEQLSPWAVYAEDSEIERGFRTTANNAMDRINEKLSQAAAALNEAEKIAEETGIPFSAGVSPLSQSYIPNSLSEMHGEIDREFINTVTDSYGEYEGWQHSAVC